MVKFWRVLCKESPTQLIRVQMCAEDAETAKRYAVLAMAKRGKRVEVAADLPGQKSVVELHVYTVLCIERETFNIVSCEVEATDADDARREAESMLKRLGKNAYIAPDLSGMRAVNMVANMESGNYRGALEEYQKIKAEQFEMLVQKSDNYRIIPYLEKHGLKCSETDNAIIVMAKGENVTDIQIRLSRKKNRVVLFEDGFTYSAEFQTEIEIGSDEKDEVIAAIMKEYGKKTVPNLTAIDSVREFDSCDISNQDGSHVLTITVSMITMDNKRPEEYCYDFLLKSFIETIDESAVIWKIYGGKLEQYKELKKREKEEREREYTRVYEAVLKESEEKINDMQGQIQVLQNENAVLETAPIEEPDNLTRVEKEQRCFQIEKELTQVHWFRFTYKRKLREELQKLSHEIRQLKDEEVNRRRMLVNERDRKIRQNKEYIKELDEKLKAILENASSEAKRRCNITD